MARDPKIHHPRHLELAHAKAAVPPEALATTFEADSVAPRSLRLSA